MVNPLPVPDWYTCPDCETAQVDVWILEGRYHHESAKGWIEFKCPGCDCELNEDLLKELGVI